MPEMIQKNLEQPTNTHNYLTGAPLNSGERRERMSRADFEPIGSFHHGLGTYSLEDSKILANYRKKAERGWFRGSIGGLGGIPLSYDEKTNNVYFDNTDMHTMILGSTGSQKTRLIALPTVAILAAAGESMIISDPKAEIYETMATELRAKGYEVCSLNFRNFDQGIGWNPLALPYQFYSNGDIDRACELANDVAVNLVSMNVDTGDPFWGNSAGSFFFGLTILLFKYCYENHIDINSVTLRNVLELRNKICDNDISPKKSEIWKYAKQDPFLCSLLIGTVETAKVTQQGILSNFDQSMRIFSIQPYLLDFLTENEIDFDLLMDKPTAIFLIMPDEKTSYHGLVSLFIKQSYEYIVYCLHQKKRQKPQLRINYILDEFSALPTVKDFPSMITAARSRNIRFALFIQSKHQLTQKYPKEAETIMSNCGNWIFLTSRELELLEEISRLCGNKDRSSSLKPVLSISDLQRFNKEKGEVLILRDRCRPYIAHLPHIGKFSFIQDSRENSLGGQIPRRYTHYDPLEFIFNESHDVDDEDDDDFFKIDFSDIDD